MHGTINMYLTPRRGTVFYRKRRRIAYKKTTRWYSMADDYNRLLVEHLPHIEKFIRSFADKNNVYLSDSEIDDLTQDMCAKLLGGAIEKFKGNSKFSTFLYSVIRNFMFDYLKKRDRLTDTETEREDVQYHVGLVTPDISSEIIDAMSFEEQQEVIRDELDSMKEDHRLIYKMYFEDQETQKDIARMMRKSQSTVSEHIENIRRRLQLALEKRYPEMKKGIH